MFAVVAVGLYLAIPRTVPFHYEFQRGRIWTYETLKAPFDYPLYKSADEYNHERNALRKQLHPVYREEPSTAQSTIAAVDGYIRRQLTAACDSLLATGRATSYQHLSAVYDSGQQARLSSTLDYLYDVGIVDKQSVLSIAPNAVFSVLRQGVSYETSLEKVFSPASGAQFLMHESRPHTSNRETQLFWASLNFEPLLTPNLIHDTALTRQVREERLASVSKTLGVVSSGTKIVGHGDVVTDESYQQLESLRIEMTQRMPSGSWHLSREICYALLNLLALGLFLLYLQQTYPNVVSSPRDVLFLLLVESVTTAIGYLVIRIDPALLYLVPFTIAPLLIRSFFDVRLAFMAHLIITSSVALFAPSSYEFMLINLSAGLMATYAQKTIYRRSRLFRVVLLVLLSYLFTYLVLKVMQEQSITSLHLMNLALFAGNALLLLATSQLTYPLEKLFGFISNSTLVDLGDTNHPLLRELAEKAPGTFQHSLQVANLAETAAVRIGANALLVRTAALYHDIGKMNHPEFFVENQHPGSNPHGSLNERESAAIIIRHVTDGVQIARKHRLPEQLTDFIRTHHGTTRTEYFYRTYRKEHPQEPDHPEWFTYPGPKPFSREMALLMITDSVEAASRSLKVITPESLRELVNGIVAKQQGEGQFDQTDITFQDIATVKETLVSKLESIYHSRIEYPDDPNAPTQAPPSDDKA